MDIVIDRSLAAEELKVDLPLKEERRPTKLVEVRRRAVQEGPRKKADQKQNYLFFSLLSLYSSKK